METSNPIAVGINRDLMLCAIRHAASEMSHLGHRPGSAGVCSKPRLKGRRAVLLGCFQSPVARDYLLVIFNGFQAGG